MLYQAYQAHSDIMVPVRALATAAQKTLGAPVNGLAGHPMMAGISNLNAAYELIARAGLTHRRPDYGIRSVTCGNSEAAVVERAVHVTPFGSLLHFRKEGVETAQPRVLVVAPLSGHFATLLRGTVKTLLPENDVYITDWHNARDVSTGHGRFGFDDYVEHLITFFEVMGPGAHVIAVCQPCVAALVAVAVMSEQGHPATPRS
ncbi:MAG: polyhydroxyalkanoate depolymerase, partial [Pseudorhodoplanes sp.]